MKFLHLESQNMYNLFKIIPLYEGAPASRRLIYE